MEELRAIEVGNATRDGRRLMLDAAARLLSSARLIDLLAFLTAQLVADAAHCSKGNFSHHFGGRSGLRPKEVFTAATIRHMLHPVMNELLEDTTRALKEAQNRSRGEPSAPSGSSGSGVERDDSCGADHRAVADSSEDLFDAEATTARLVAAAVAPNDEQVAGMLRATYRATSDQTEGAVRELLEITGRRLLVGLSVDQLTAAIVALNDGYEIRRRFDATVVSSADVRDTAVRLFAGMTTEANAPDDPYPMLMGMDLTDTTLDPDTVARIQRAARERYFTLGWPGLTEQSVARRAGCEPRLVRLHAGGRDGLAHCVWSKLVPVLIEGMDRDDHLGLVERTNRHVQRLVELARQHGDLSRALLRLDPALSDLAQFPLARPLVRHPAVDGMTPSDATALVLRNQVDFLPPAVTARNQGVEEFANLVTYSALRLALTRPLDLSSAIADLITDMFLTSAFGAVA
jgi:AcrR family transcriptional regulator